MPDRYYSQVPIRDTTVTLSGPEAHHLIHVMRARPGLEVVVFDGSGAEWSAWVAEVRRNEVRLTLGERREADRELRAGLTLGVALPRGDRQKWLVEKAVELGVTRLVPLVTARCVAQPVQEAVSRLERSVVEASKQCGRNRLMEIGQAQAWEEYVEQPGPAIRWVAHPGGECGLGQGTLEQPVRLAVGPEGGFTDEEVARALAAGWRPIDLGPRILRVETAAICLVSWAVERLPWSAAIHRRL